MKVDVIVLIGQIASGKTTLGRHLASVFDANFVEIETLPVGVRREGPKAIARILVGSQLTRTLVFECSGTSETFEELLSELQRSAKRVIVVKLLCELPVALERQQMRSSWRPPASGISWPQEIRRTETRLRRVPADLTVDTTDVSCSRAAHEVSEFLKVSSMTNHRTRVARSATQSFSRLALHERCPLAYEFKYVAGEPELFLSAKTLLGDLVHQALSNLYSARERSGNLKLDEVLAFYRDSVNQLSKVWDSPDLVQWLVSEGTEVLTFHYETVFLHDQLTTLRVDYPFSFDLGSGRKIVGQIDRLAESKGKIPIVIDYKTGSERVTYLSDVPDLLQLDLYGMAMLTELQVDAVEVRRHAVRFAHEESYGVTFEDVPRIRSSVLRWIRKMEQSQYPEAKPGKVCEWCAYNPKCAKKAISPGFGLTLPTAH